MSPTIQIRSTVFPNPLNQNPDFSRGSQFGGRPVDLCIKPPGFKKIPFFNR